MESPPRYRATNRQLLSQLLRVNDLLASEAFNSFVQHQAPSTKRDLLLFRRQLQTCAEELILMDWTSNATQGHFAPKSTQAAFKHLADHTRALDDGVRLAAAMRDVISRIDVITTGKARMISVLNWIGAVLLGCVLFFLLFFYLSPSAHLVTTSEPGTIGYVDTGAREVEVYKGRKFKSWFRSQWFDWVPPNLRAQEPTLIGKIKQGQPVSQEKPIFPWPPPRPSAIEVIPRALLIPSPVCLIRLEDVNNSLDDAFRRCGYGEKSYYTLGDGYPGFALATRIEQINKDGTPSVDRWSVDVPAMREFSLRAYLRALFTAGRTGHFRIIVFVVTSQSFAPTDRHVDATEAEAWAKKGWNLLPRLIAEDEYSIDYNCTALIYEFERIGGRPARFVEPSRMTGRLHLAKAGLLSALSYPGNKSTAEKLQAASAAALERLKAAREKN